MARRGGAGPRSSSSAPENVNQFSDEHRLESRRWHTDVPASSGASEGIQAPAGCYPGATPQQRLIAKLLNCKAQCLIDR